MPELDDVMERNDTTATKEQLVAHYKECGLNTDEFVRLLCQKVSEVFIGDFPCFCEESKARHRIPVRLSSKEVEKAFDVLECLDLLK